MTNSSFEHSGKQIGTLTGEKLEEALLPLPSGLAGGFASVPIQRQSLCFIIQHDSMGLEWRTQMGATNARCQPLALPFSLSLPFLHAQIHTHALQHWLPLFPLASPSCLPLWPYKPSLFICYYIGSVRSNKQGGACRVCQHRELRFGVCWTFCHFRRILALCWWTSVWREGTTRPGCLCVPAANWLCLPPCSMLPLSTAASEGLSAVLMRISMFVLFICVSP